MTITPSQYDELVARIAHLEQMVASLRTDLDRVDLTLGRHRDTVIELYELALKRIKYLSTCLSAAMKMLLEHDLLLFPESRVPGRDASARLMPDPEKMV
jgi:hypothetical protein